MEILPGRLSGWERMAVSRVSPAPAELRAPKASAAKETVEPLAIEAMDL